MATITFRTRTGRVVSFAAKRANPTKRKPRRATTRRKPARGGRRRVHARQ